MEKRRLCCLLTLLLALALPAVAGAYTADLFGLNMRALALVNAQAAMAEGPAATFYNPAMLAAQGGVQMEMTYLYSLSSFSLKVFDADGVKQRTKGELKRAQKTRPVQYLGMGVSGRISDYVGLGLYMNLPIDGEPRPRIYQPQSPYWLKYGTSVNGLQLYPAVSVRIIPNVMIGVGTVVVLDASGQQSLAFPTSEGRTASMEASGKWSGGAAAIAGVFYRPLEFLQVGFTYRGESFIRDKRKTTMSVDVSGSGTYEALPVKTDVVWDYSPQAFDLGIVGDPFEWWRITMDLVYTSWSMYKPPFPKIRPQYAELATELPAARTPVLIDVGTKDVNFSDTLVVRLGLDFKPIKQFEILFGYAYEPSPVPKQTGTTNILDANEHLIGLGFGVNVGGKDNDLVRLDLGGQFHLIADRSFSKSVDKMNEFYASDPSLNPGYAKVEAKASYFVGGLSAKFHF
jgi:long-subunit fatty acid transport protein